MIYDYYGFAPEAYEIDYPAPGNPRIAEKLRSILEEQNIHAQLDKRWGFDHGMFVPLKLMYPDARIPCVQLSLINDLDPLQHIKVGCALRALKDEKILVLGSGFSFHNMKTFGETGKDPKNIEFDQWLVKTMTDPLLSPSDRKDRLFNWQDAPHARYCHPTEEHLLPLHVCYGITEMPARLVFIDLLFLSFFQKAAQLGDMFFFFFNNLIYLCTSQLGRNNIFETDIKQDGFFF